MERNNKVKKSDIKNHTCYYFDDIINLNFVNFLLDEK